MAPLKVEQYVVGPVQTNCYFAINDATKEVLVIDPGASADQLAKKICQEKLTPIAILLTHDILTMRVERRNLQNILISKYMPRSMKKRP